MAINVGSPAIDRNNYYTSGYTDILLANPATEAGIINTVSIYVNSAITGLKVGVFYSTGSGTFRCRSYAAIGNAVVGLNVFSGLNITVNVGDYIGTYFSGGRIDAVQTTGEAGVYEASGDKFSGTNDAYTLYTDTTMSALGQFIAAAGKKWNGVTIAKWNGALVSKINNI